MRRVTLFVNGTTANGKVKGEAAECLIKSMLYSC